VNGRTQIRNNTEHLCNFSSFGFIFFLCSFTLSVFQMLLSLFSVILLLPVTVMAQSKGKCYKESRKQPEQDILQGANANEPFAPCLAAHNAARLLVGLSPISWSSSLANSAKKWTSNLEASRTFHHSGSGPGENIYRLAGNGNCISALAMWMQERSNYDRWRGAIGAGNFMSYGHFTQIMVRLFNVDP
jgi:Cysteine-rich secretory protein family